MAKSNGLIKRGKVWHVRFTDGSGQRISKSTGTTDKRQARQLLDQWKAESWRETKLGELKRRTWPEAVTRYLAESTHKKSLQTDVYRLRKLDRYLGGLYLDQVNQAVIRRISEEQTEAV